MGIEALYIHVGTISRPTRTSDGQGGWAVGYADAGTVSGRLRPATASEITTALQRQATVTHVWYCSTDDDVRRGDLVTVGDQTVEVLAVREPSHMAHHLECDCAEIQKEAEQESGS